MKGSGEPDLSPLRRDATTSRRRSRARSQLRRCVEHWGISPRFRSGEPTRAAPDAGASPLELAVGLEAVRRYEAALARLRPRDREAVRGRIERQWSYLELAKALRVTKATLARTVVTRALGRLLDAMAE
jgi:DNA-directed RNA polymerase specialized sigma24 family protein